MVKRLPELKDLVKAIGRPLRVATMCSGTESPLLALDKIGAATGQIYDAPLGVDHVFSCEIEPFKQAYIERNFAPPILFRDIRELDGDQATTAYGALVDVPGNVDMLVAGTSCVDYSNLNNEKKDIDEAGESGQTFRGMMTWIKKHEPPIVILENVCGAPWDKIAERFRQQGYQADYTRLDTKRYYIPHTRTRVYLVAVRKNPGETFIPADFPTEFKAIGSLASKEVKDKEGNAKKMKPTGKKLVNRLSEDADVAEQKARPPHTGPHTTAFAW
jgi:site-specific DNA-cytosine methylase